MTDDGWCRILERSQWEKKVLGHWWRQPVIIAGMEWRHGTQRFFPNVRGGSMVVKYLALPGYRGQEGDLNFRIKRFLVNVQRGRENLFHGLLSPKEFAQFMKEWRS